MTDFKSTEGIFAGSDDIDEVCTSINVEALRKKMLDDLQGEVEAGSLVEDSEITERRTEIDGVSVEGCKVELTSSAEKDIKIKISNEFESIAFDSEEQKQNLIDVYTKLLLLTAGVIHEEGQRDSYAIGKKTAVQNYLNDKNGNTVTSVIGSELLFHAEAQVRGIEKVLGEGKVPMSREEDGSFTMSIPPIYEEEK